MFRPAHISMLCVDSFCRLFHKLHRQALFHIHDMMSWMPYMRMHSIYYMFFRFFFYNAPLKTVAIRSGSWTISFQFLVLFLFLFAHKNYVLHTNSFRIYSLVRCNEKATEWYNHKNNLRFFQCSESIRVLYRCSFIIPRATMCNVHKFNQTLRNIFALGIIQLSHEIEAKKKI